MANNDKFFTDYAPYPMSEINFVENFYQPSTFHSFNSASYWYWQRALYQRAVSSFDITLPDEWSGSTKDFFYYVLLKYGYVAVLETPEEGLIFQPCTLNGYNIYYQPTDILIANPYMKESVQRVIGKDCELLKLTPDYRGIWDIIRYYGSKLAIADASLDMTLINSRIAYIIGAKNKSAASALKVIMDKVMAGQSTVVYDKEIECSPGDSEPFAVFDRKSTKDSYMGEDILETVQTLISNFDCEIGIPVMPQEKKERMIVDEVNSRIADGMARATIWEETFNSSAENVNARYGTSIKMELKYKNVQVSDEKGGDGKNVSENDVNWSV